MLVDSPEDDNAVEVVGDELVVVDEDVGDGAGMLTLSSISPIIFFSYIQKIFVIDYKIILTILKFFSRIILAI